MLRNHRHGSGESSRKLRLIFPNIAVKLRGFVLCPLHHATHMWSFSYSGHTWTYNPYWYAYATLQCTEGKGHNPVSWRDPGLATMLYPAHTSRASRMKGWKFQMTIRIDLDTVNEFTNPNSGLFPLSEGHHSARRHKRWPYVLWWNASASYWAIFARFPLLNHIYSDVGWGRHGLLQID